MKPQIPWLRVFVEGVVLVGSILLAFGLQAWWEGRQEREAEREALLLIHSDLVADTIELAFIGARAEAFRQAVGWLRDHYDDPTVTPEELDE